MREVISMSILPVIGSFMMPLFNIINTGVCGYIGDPNMLAGYGLGSLAIAIFVVSTTVQLTSLQTVVNQANGSKDYRLARIYLHRQYVITFMGLLVVLIPIIYIEPILLAIGQDP